MINALIVDITKCDFDYNLLYASLSESGKLKIDKYIKHEDKVRSLIGQILINRFTPVDEEITYSENGKPYKKSVLFNLSHSKDMVVLVTSKTHEVGVDIEYIEDEIKDGIDSFSFGEKLSPIEFYFKWTRREAIGKCTGKGIFTNFKEIPSSLGLNNYCNRNIYVETEIIGKYALSVAYESTNKLDIKIQNIDRL